LSDELLLTPAIAAERLGISRTVLYEKLMDGEIESLTIGRSRRIPVAALTAYVERLRTEQSHLVEADAQT